MDRSVTQACRAAPSGDEKCGFRCRGVPFILTSFCLAPFGNENGLKCRLKVSYCTLGRRKGAEVSPKRTVFYSWETKSMGFVAEESLHPYVILSYTHGQQKWTEVSPERVVPHSWATKMRDSVAQACRAALLGDENVRKCCLSVSYFTLGRRKVWVSLPKSPFILTSFCPTPTGNKNGRKCRLNVSCRTLGQRKVWISLPKSPLHPYVILPCTFRQRKWAEVLPESVVLHPRATKRRDSVAQACRAALLGDEEALKCRSSVSCRTLGRRYWVKMLPEVGCGITS